MNANTSRPRVRESSTTKDALTVDLDGASPKRILEILFDRFGDRVAVASSFGAEDMVLVHLVGEIKRERNQTLRVFTLDTGRLPEETHALMERARAKYSIAFEVFAPDHLAVENLVRTKGSFSFFDSVDERKHCCGIRKVEPLKRALSTVDVWVTGLRRAQSVTRDALAVVETDVANGGILKVSPLANWSEREVWDFVRSEGVPTNALHESGVPSIGCAPCTRAVPSWTKGEGDLIDIRSGRWWWEDPSHKECGLHAAPSHDARSPTTTPTTTPDVRTHTGENS